jgi:hypothetical protein
MKSHTNFDSDQAEVIALKALNYILADENLQQGFLATSGVSPDEFKDLISDPEFLGGVLDFLLGNEEQLIAFCEANEIEPTEPAKARRLFPGAVLDY